MSLEALVGGTHFQLHLDSALAPRSLFLTTVPLSQMSLIGIIT
jgi:hypothetical protein